MLKVKRIFLGTILWLSWHKVFCLVKKKDHSRIVKLLDATIVRMEPEHLESLYPDNARQKEIDQILSYVKDGQSCQLISMPGAGRGNLLNFLAYNRTLRVAHLGEEGYLKYHFVLANFSEVKNRPLLDVMKFLFLELSSSLHERRREEEFAVVDAMFKEALSYNDELVLFQGLKKAIDYLTLEKDITVVFLLERFETYVPLVTQDFFNNLRSIRNRAKYKFSVVFSVTRPLEEILEPTILADFYEFVIDHHIYISLLDKPGIDFRVTYLEKLTGKKISVDTIKTILELTSGHGKLTRLALEIASSTSSSRNDVNEQYLLSHKTIRGALFEIWNFLSPDEQNDVFAAVKGQPVTNAFLEKIHILNNGKVSILLLETFIKENLTQEVQEEQHISYNADTNVISKGHQTLSNVLTSSEFKLLRFLIEHQENIIDREQLIQAVWTDSKSMAGVSDQAVDQLIFRLRKKIEDDPNNPIHIQTVKGRGIKFSP